jgi:chromosome segregation ATPase
LPSPTGAPAADFEAELARHATRTAELEAGISERDARLAAHELGIGELRAKVSKLSGSDDEDVGRQISALESMLSERAAELSRALRDLKESERIGRELVRELESARRERAAGNGAQATASSELPELGELKTKLDRLAALNAEREADLLAARWTIEKLEARIEEPQAIEPSAGGAKVGEAPQVAAADHETVQASDSQRDELERRLDSARAELQRQAALIDQLRAQALLE